MADYMNIQYQEQAAAIIMVLEQQDWAAAMNIHGLPNVWVWGLLIRCIHSREKPGPIIMVMNCPKEITDMQTFNLEDRITTP